MASRSPADKLRSSLPAVPRPGRYSGSTRKALINQAEKLFTSHGYAGTSLDTIVRKAQVTKGALYHHFSGKQAVFEAVFEKIEADAVARVRKQLKGVRDPWEKARTGLHAFLEVVQDPGYQRVVIQEGPAVLGYERFREQEERSSFGLVHEIVESLLERTLGDVDPGQVATFSRIVWGALSSAGESVTDAADPAAMVEQVESAMAFLLAGLQTLAESGASLDGAVGSDDAARQDAG